MSVEISISQADGAWNRIHSAEAQPDETEKVEQLNRRRRMTLTKKGREYGISILGKKKSRLVSRVIRKSSETNDLLYSYQDATSVKEKLVQLNNIYKLIVEINNEMTEINVNYSEELWFAEIDEKFSPSNIKFTREGENGAKREKGSKSSGSRSKSSGLRVSSKEKATQEKLREAELRTEASFIKKKREAELQAQSFRLEEEMAKAEAKVKIYEEEKLDARVQSEKLVVTEEPGKTSKYTWDGPLLTEQRDQRKNYVILRDRHQRDMKNGNKEGKEMTTTQSALNIGNQNEMIDRSYHDTGIPPRRTDGIRLMLCRLIEEQSPPDVEIEEFDGNTLNFNCFRSTFHKTVQ